MRRDLLELLACPGCYASEFLLESAREDTAEIRAGSVICRGCGGCLAIEEGILNALQRPTDVVMREIAGNRLLVETERPRVTEEWLLGLPGSYSELYSDKDESWQNEEKEVRSLVDLVDPGTGEVVLDLGAGTTWTTDLLARRGCRAVAIDISTEKYVGLSSGDVFMKHHGSYYERIVADMSSRLPFRDGCADAVFGFSAIHHAPDLERTIREISRILKPTGTLALVESTRGMLESERGFGLQKKEDYGLNERKYKLREYQRLLTAAGMKVKIYPAPSFAAKMGGLQKGSVRVPGPMMLKHRVGKIVARTIWQLPWAQGLASTFYPLLCHLVGMQILAVAEKVSPASALNRN